MKHMDIQSELIGALLSIGNNLMRSILILLGFVCAGPALSADLVAARFVTLTPTNQSGLIVAVTLTNAFDGPVEGRVYMVGASHRTDLLPGLAVVDWKGDQSSQQEDQREAYKAMMMHRYGLGTKFEVEGGREDTIHALMRTGFSQSNGVALVVQYLPPKMKERNADWSKVRFLRGEIRRPSEADRKAALNPAVPHR